jgi:hypothetical protein
MSLLLISFTKYSASTNDLSFHACLSETEIPQIPKSEATHFLPVGTISEYQAYNKNRVLRLFITHLSVI